METSKVTNPTEQSQMLPANGRVLPADELKRLTDFFSILIQIDKQIAKRKNYGIQSK